MKHYTIKFVREEWLDLEVEANSEQEAYDNFMSGKYDISEATSKGFYLNEDINIETEGE